MDDLTKERLTRLEQMVRRRGGVLDSSTRLTLVMSLMSFAKDGSEIMDPNVNLREQLELASRLVEAVNPRPSDVHRLAELVLAMDEWRQINEGILIMGMKGEIVG